MDLLEAQRVFPNNVTLILLEELSGLPDVDVVVARPLRPNDPNFSIGIAAINWTPGEYEMKGRSNPDPTTTRYTYSVQAFVKHTDQSEGLAFHAYLSKMVRLMLYRSDSLRVRLAGLSETVLGVTERSQRWGVSQQRYVSNEIDGTWLHLSTTEFFLDTETI
jgi:hypothetical protein